MKRTAAALALVLAACPLRAAGFKWRGVLEGFYGRPWTWEQRARMVDWMARRGDNLFVIAPKDEPAQRADWRAPLSSEYMKNLKRLQAQAKARSVALAWTLSPLGFKNDVSDLAAALVKFRQVSGQGLRKLAIAFDDTEPDVEQIDFANRVLSDLSSDFPDLEMTFVPAQYWGKAAPSKYLDAVALRLDQRFLVAWTGPGIISQTITAADGRKFRAYIGHKLVLGDNYPVQDRLIDAGPLYLGPLIGRDPGLVYSQEAFVSNASPLPEASKIPLATAADFARDPDHYDAQKSWHRAIADTAGPAGAHWLELLARECATSWISDPAPNWISRDSIGEAIARWWETYDSQRVKAFDKKWRRHPVNVALDDRLLEFAALPSKLRDALKPRPGMYEELRPWAEKLAAQASVLEATYDADPARRNRARIAAERNPAVVADLALERACLELLSWNASTGRHDGRSPGMRLEEFAADPRHGEANLDALNRLSIRAVSYQMAPKPTREGDLLPWELILGMSAKRTFAHAVAQMNGSALPPFIPERLWRWRMRSRMFPLVTSRALLESFFDDIQSRWKPAPLKARKLGWLGLWLGAESWIRSEAFPVVLKGALARYRGGGKPDELAALFDYLAGLPHEIRRLEGTTMIPETGPWLDKVGAYGALGRKALEYERVLREGGRLTDEQKRDWDRDRERIASSNGLELAVKLNYRLNSYVRWSRIPTNQRPKVFKVDWPANPADIF